MIILVCRGTTRSCESSAPYVSIYYCRHYVWEIMHSTIQKMSKHVEKLQKEAEEARDLLDAAKRKVTMATFNSITAKFKSFPWTPITFNIVKALRKERIE